MKKIMSNQYVFSLFTKVLIVIMGIIASVFVNRFLGVSLRGEYAFTLNIITIVVLILNLGIDQSYPYLKNKCGEHMKDKIFNIVIFQFIFYLVLGLLLSLLLSDSRLTIIFTLTPLMILTRQLNFISLVENVNMVNKLNIGNQIFYVSTLLLVFLFAPQNIFYVFILLYIKDIIIVIRIIIKYQFKFSIKEYDKKIALETIKFGFFPMLTGILISMNYNIDVILLKFFVDYKNIGYYSVGVTLANQVWLIPDAFKDVLFSKITKKDSLEDLLLSIKINIYIGIATIILIIACGKFLIELLYGYSFIRAYSITVIIIFGLIPMIIFKLVNTLFIVKGKQKESFYILLLSVVLNIISNLILIPKFGIEGAGISSVLSYSVCGLLFLLMFFKEFSTTWRDILIFNESEINRIKYVLSRRK